MTDYEPKRQVGDIFYSGDLRGADPNGVHSYWKITRPAIISFGHLLSYPVIKCSQWGKEYKETNGFSVSAVDEIPDYRIGKVGRPYVAPLGEKAAIDDGIKSAKRINRIAFLKARINDVAQELDELNKVQSDYLLDHVGNKEQ